MQKEAAQERKYDIPYHYMWDRSTVEGLIYRAYIDRAVEIVRKEQPKRMVDIGCGDARFISLLDGIPVEGADYSERSLVFATLYNPDRHFTVADAKALPFNDNTFDCVSLIEVIEHFPPDEVPTVLQECRRVLQPNGLLLMTTPTTNEHKMSKAHYQHFTKESMSAYLLDAGFQVTAIEGNYKKSPWQILLQGLMCNRLYAVRHKGVFGMYQAVFQRYWEHCDLSVARRMIVQARCP